MGATPSSGPQRYRRVGHQLGYEDGQRLWQLAPVSANDDRARDPAVRRLVALDSAWPGELFGWAPAGHAMWDTYIMRRTQIYLDEKQHRLLDVRAHALGTTKSALIRDAIDAFLGREPVTGDELQRLRAGVAEAAGVAPSLPSGHDYVDALRELDARRGA